MKYIVGGHFTDAPEGWKALSEQDCDITKQLPFADNTVDTIFEEHVFEHIDICSALNFIKESHRTLKKGGILRTVCPTINKLTTFKNDELGQLYAQFQTQPYYVKEDAALKELGLKGVAEEPIMFMLDSLFKGHNHRMIWSAEMIKKVLEKIGFSEVYICEPGETHFDKSDCLERVVRGIHPQVAFDMGITAYDCESQVIEAKK